MSQHQNQYVIAAESGEVSSPAYTEVHLAKGKCRYLEQTWPGKNWGIYTLLNTKEMGNGVF